MRQHVSGAPAGLRVLVLDAAAISDIDYTGLQALRGLVIELRQRGLEVRVASTSHLVHHDLKHGALLELLGPDRLFTSVEEAVAAPAASEATAALVAEPMSD